MSRTCQDVVDLLHYLLSMFDINLTKNIV